MVPTSPQQLTTVIVIASAVVSVLAIVVALMTRRKPADVTPSAPAEKQD